MYNIQLYPDTRYLAVADIIYETESLYERLNLLCESRSDGDLKHIIFDIGTSSF